MKSTLPYLENQIQLLFLKYVGETVCPKTISELEKDVHLMMDLAKTFGGVDHVYSVSVKAGVFNTVPALITNILLRYQDDNHEIVFTFSDMNVTISNTIVPDAEVMVMELDGPFWVEMEEGLWWFGDWEIEQVGDYGFKLTVSSGVEYAPFPTLEAAKQHAKDVKG